MDTSIINKIIEMTVKNPPVNSLLENDLYKYSMGQFVLHRYPTCKVRIDFKCRSNAKIGYLKPLIDHCLDHLCTLRYSDDEISYLRKISWLSEDFVDYLRRFYLFREQIHTDVSPDGQLIMYAEGPWRDVIWFEVPCLAIVEECYMKYELLSSNIDLNAFENDRTQRLITKTNFYNSFYNDHKFTISEFGMRRRFSRDWQDQVVKSLKENCNAFVGTSNVYLAKKYDVIPCGTMAHELYMGLQGVGIQLRNVQKETWRQWMEEFRGKNGILLSDIFGFNACCKDLDWYIANSFSGFRHDSGNPLTWGEMLISRLKELGIDPTSKIGCWSDCLNPELAMTILGRFHDRIKIAFGIGTDFVCDTLIKPLSIVMKMTYSNGTPVLKLSDSEGKGMCPDPTLIEYAKHVYDYKSIGQ